MNRFAVTAMLAAASLAATAAAWAAPAAVPLGLAVVSLVLTTIAVFFLFRRDAVAWFGASA